MPVFDTPALHAQAAVALSPERPILIDKFLDNAVEAEAEGLTTDDIIRELIRRVPVS